MPIYQRKGSPFWYSRIGRGFDRSTGTTNRNEAIAVDAQWRSEILNRKEGTEWTFGEAAAKWAEDVGSKRKGWDRDWYRLRALVQSMADAPINSVGDDLVRLAIPPSAKSPASRNHYLSLVRSTLRYAQRLGHLATVPPLRFARASNARLRYLRDWKEANRLINAMPEHWRDPARFSLYTGVRQGTLRALRTEWLSGDLLVIPGAHTKSSRTLPLPLAAEALRIVYRQPERPWIFTRANGQPLPKMHWKVWERIRDKSGIEDFRWHDLRHTWASWAVMNGVTLYELQQLGDWSTPSMVQRYAHLSPEYLRGAASKLGVPHRVQHRIPHSDGEA